MVHHQEDLRRELASKNPEFKKLLDEHANYESRLEELQGKASLEDAERLETVNLKKQKLHVKDRMEQLVREHIEKTAGTAVRH